jgi:ribosome-binding protein aMBF1 (putative translation factor)
MAKQTTKAMKTKQNVGQAMRDARRRLGWTQLDLARRAGCTESLVTKIETGRATPEQSLKEAIARELSIQTWEVGV